MPAYKRILVAVDGSETSNHALVAALQLARDTGARVRVVHAVDELAYLSGYEFSGDVIAIVREQAGKILSDALAIAKSSGVEADSQLLDQPGQRLGDVIAEAARKWEADMVVVGTHGRRGIGRVLLGSGAEQIIRLASTPVLVIRGQEKD